MLSEAGVNCGWRVLVIAAEADAGVLVGMSLRTLLSICLGVMFPIVDSQIGGSSAAFGASKLSVKPGEAAATSEETSARCSLSS